MRYKPAATVVLAAVSIGVAAPPALARREHRPNPAARERQENAAIKRALRTSGSALRTAHAAQHAVAKVAAEEVSTSKSLGSLSALVATIDRSLTALSSSVASVTASVQSLTSGVSTLNSEVNDPNTGLSALNSDVNDLNSGLGALNSQVNDPNSGLGKVDDGVLELIVTPSGSSTPEQIGQVFAPDIPQAVGAGSTASGTVTFPCTASGGCTFSLYAADDSNRPQPSSGAAAYVGGVLTVTSDGTGAPGQAVTFVTAGETPSNSNLGGSPLVAIPSRSPLGSKYPYPGQSGSVLVPIQTASNGSSGTITVPQGLYTLSTAINFIGKLGG
jgi:uncharacterized phage infection (PIP) family protein YhgE